ncbi:hypothetical protein [Synechococcus sp. GEYO]|uniref:hypothetical protein n=1 Tax=Synechococcus sp. GEYO TaxID=2575511 RepID=UPI000E0F9A47|nr:hypothetical protein [Synechococcus sp. GEYO]
MADSQPLDSLRLALMQEVLPMGLAFVDRVRTDGPAKAVESVARGDDPLGDLREQGEVAAREVRERLDQISPGLGNPVMSVQVEVDEPVALQDSLDSDHSDASQLQDVLARIDGRLQRLDALVNKVS